MSSYIAKEVSPCLRHISLNMKVCLLVFFFFFWKLFGEGNGNSLQYSCLEDPVDRGAWWATVHGVTRSRTRLSNQAYLEIVFEAYI